MNKEIYVKFCPKCFSNEIESLSPAALGAGVPTQYTCQDCNYSSFMFPEATREELEKIKKEKSKLMRS